MPRRPRHHHRRPVAATLLAGLALALAATPAGAQRSPFQPLPAAPQTTPSTTSAATASQNSDDGIENWQVLLLALGGVLLITGIAFAISRDAREHVRGLGRSVDREYERPAPDAHRSSREAKKRQRQKQKSARAQRRRNR